jgi:hypothetical protein
VVTFSIQQMCISPLAGTVGAKPASDGAKGGDPMRSQALDYSYARPSAEELLAADCDALFYVGVSRPDQVYCDSLSAVGLHWTMIFETLPDRSQQGYQAGVYDAQFSDARADQRNYSRDAAIAVVVSDGNRYSPSTGGDAIADYAEGWARTCLRPIFFYGNRYAVDHAIAGARRAPTPHLLAGPRGDGGWVPSSWGADPERDPIVQEANLVSPLVGTDLNSVHGDYHGAPAPVPAPPPQITPEDDMELAIGPLIGQIGNVALLMAGAKCVAEFTGPTVDVFGMAIPASMIAWRDLHPSRAAIKLVYLGTDAFAGAIMANLRWTDWQTGAGLV